MKNPTGLILILLALLLSGCKNCNSGLDCCNPETSKLYISQYLEDWFPYETGDSIILTNNSSEALKFKVANLVKKDTGYFQGDECPDRPGEFRSGIIVSHFDTLIFRSDLSSNIVVEIDHIKFLIGDYPIGKQVHSYDQITNVEMKDSLTLLSRNFQDLIIAQSDSGEVQEIYLSNGLGIVGIKKNNIIYEVP